MLGIIKLVCSYQFIIGAIFGVVAGAVFKPLLIALLGKIVKKNV